jgi:DNA-directed RNA polymerase specialized sigma24 family protein
VADRAQRDEFQRVMLPHLDDAFNLARWLTGNRSDAEDVVQEAFLKALTFDHCPTLLLHLAAGEPVTPACLHG